MIISNTKANFNDVVIRPKRSALQSRNDVSLTRSIKVLHSETLLTGVPIIASNMDTIGTFQMANSLQQHQMYTCLHKFYTYDDIISNLNKDIQFNFTKIFYSIGFNIDEYKQFIKIQQIIKDNYNTYLMLCIDVANGYMQNFVDFVKKIRDENPNNLIMAGNVATPEITETLLLAGADIIKIGIGSGGACDSTTVTGVGYPQLSAVIECGEAARGLNGHICSDGGCKTVGDICKAICGGADFVMLGSMLAGHDECDAVWDYKYNEKHEHIKESMTFYGMSSKYAQLKNYGKMVDYRASEGKVIKVPYKGPIKDLCQQIIGGLKSCGTYIGAKTINDFHKCTTFIKIT